ncbi:jhy protein homolog [Serinus canaria]|uniref:jhy protein homolog n=1 Tax=Serinus canaria TaxID=9135 RepID=UPI0004F123EB|nr:jhy protein homolog [Serinus canaria]
MNPSDMKYISVSSPHTHSTTNIHVPPKTLVPPVFQAASWERQGSSACSPEHSQDSDSEGLEKQRQLQLAGQEAGDSLEDDSLDGDSLEGMSSGEEGAENDPEKEGKPKICGSGRKNLPVDKYSSLRCNPHWKNAKKGADFLEAEKASQMFGGGSGDFSVDSFYLHCDGSSENHPQEAESQDSLPEFEPELFSFSGANVASHKPDGPQAKREEPADGFHPKNNPGHAFPPQNQQDPPQRAKKNFVKKNKRTLGLQSERMNSYLELHNKKQQVLQGQVPDPAAADEEPLQNVPAPQAGRMKPEEQWHPKGEQLKEQPRFLQRPRAEPLQPLGARALPSRASQEPPAAAGEANPWIQRLQHTPGFQAAPPALGQDPSSALHPIYHFPNSILTSPAYFLPIFQNFYPPEVLNPEYPSQEDKKYQQDSAAGIPQQFPASAIPGQHFPRNNSSSDQAHPELENILSEFNAIFQERVKDQSPLPDFKNHIHEDHSSPTSACRISHFIEKDQHQPRICDFEDDFAGTWLWGLFPPALPQEHRGSQGDSGKAEGNPRKMRRSSSEGSLLQREKQNQPKVSKKLGGSKFCLNLSMKLGGLGPDYETIKEKKEKMKLQKEYSRQIKEYNMKNITVLQRLPAKPPVSVARQKALEYAKSIPRPRTFLARPEQEVKEALPRAPAAPSLPKIPSLESLWSRHEKEKEAVAAFEALHIL